MIFILYTDYNIIMLQVKLTKKNNVIIITLVLNSYINTLGSVVHVFTTEAYSWSTRPAAEMLSPPPAV